MGINSSRTLATCCTESTTSPWWSCYSTCSSPWLTAPSRRLRLVIRQTLTSLESRVHLPHSLSVSQFRVCIFQSVHSKRSSFVMLCEGVSQFTRNWRRPQMRTSFDWFRVSTTSTLHAHQYPKTLLLLLFKNRWSFIDKTSASTGNTRLNVVYKYFYWRILSSNAIYFKTTNKLLLSDNIHHRCLGRWSTHPSPQLSRDSVNSDYQLPPATTHSPPI